MDEAHEDGATLHDSLAADTADELSAVDRIALQDAIARLPEQDRCTVLRALRGDDGATIPQALLRKLQRLLDA